jgi:RNA polymerase sigma-70 factor (ECF subfamily)
LSTAQSTPANADRIAWNSLIARHQRAVVNALLSRGIRVDRAKDLAQAAWAKLWERQVHEGLARLELPGLAIRQAFFLAADEQRAAKPRETLALVSPTSPLEAEAHVVSRAQLRQIQDELQRVVPSMQQVFFLAHNGEGLSHAEIALRSGLSVQRVRQVLCELRQRLRGVLDEEDGR